VSVGVLWGCFKWVLMGILNVRGSSLCESGCEVLPGGRGMVRVFVGGVGSSGGGTSRSAALPRLRRGKNLKKGDEKRNKKVKKKGKKRKKEKKEQSCIFCQLWRKRR